MRTRLLHVIALLTLALAVFVPLPIAHIGETASSHHTNLSGAAPLLFVENVGQFDAHARFQAYGSDSVLLADDALWFALVERAPAPASPDHLHRLSDERARAPQRQRGVYLKLSFVGASPRSRLVPFDRLTTHISYFRGNNPSGWRSDVPAWGGVRYRDLYPEIDLELQGAGGQLQPRLVVRPGARLSAVRLHVEGAEQVAVGTNTISLKTSIGPVSLPLLTLMTAQGQRLAAPEPAQSQGNIINAPFAASERTGAAAQAGSAPRFSTFLGGTVADYSHGIAVDTSGAAYVALSVTSSDFPSTPGAFDRIYGVGTCGAPPNTYLCSDIAIAKLSPSGSALIYATFLGGGGEDAAGGIVIDSSGAAYVTGATASDDFPTTGGAFNRTYRNTCPSYLCSDAFVAKLNATGSELVYATYLGGGNEDRSNNIAVDADGAAHVVGHTFSTDFPTTPGAFNRSHSGADDAFVAKLNHDGSALVYSSFIGGTDRDCYYCDIGLDAAGNTYITGWTTSPDFPTTPGAFDRTFGGSTCAQLCDDAYVVKLNPGGSALVYSTFLGGSAGDGGGYIAVDGGGAAYVAGYTFSSNFPTSPSAFDRSQNGGADIFVVKLNQAGSELIYSTFMGGKDDESATSIVRERTGAIYVTGSTNSADFPATPSAFDTTFGGGTCGGAPNTYPCYDAFVAKFDPAGAGLTYAAFLGGSADDTASGIGVDGASAIYITGSTASIDFPATSGAFATACSGCNAGGADGFVTKFALGTAQIYVPLVTVGLPACDDQEDVNDDQVNAPPLSPLNIACGGSLQDDPIGEDDWYWVDLPAGKTLSVHLSGLASGADYNLYLWRFDINTRVGASEQIGQADEQLSYTNPGGSTVRIHVRIRIASKSLVLSNSYVLRADVQ